MKEIPLPAVTTAGAGRTTTEGVMEHLVRDVFVLALLLALPVKLLFYRERRKTGV